MKRLIILPLLFMAISATAQIDKIVGSWCTIDDEIHKPVSIVRIYKATNGKYYGRIEEVTYPGYEDALCVKCEGELHNKPMKGLVIIQGMTYNEKSKKLEGGRVLDPNRGKFYYGAIWYDAKKDCLILRGSLDKRGIFGRSQEWQHLPKE